MDRIEEDWLDARLRDETPYLDDAGFTAAVVERLPRKSASTTFRALVLLLVTLLGSAIAYVVSGGGRFIVDAIARVGSLPLFSVYLIALCCGILVTTAAGAVAVSKARQQS